MRDSTRAIVADQCVAAIRRGDVSPEEGLILAIFPPEAVVAWADEQADAIEQAQATREAQRQARQDRANEARRKKRANKAVRLAENKRRRELRRMQAVA